MPVKKNRTFEDYYPGFANSDTRDEKRITSVYLGTISASGNYDVLIAPSTIKITKISLAVTTTVAVSTSNYWSLQANNVTQLDDLLSTADDTNYDTALTADTLYEITPDQNNYLREDDVLQIQLTKNSSASNLVALLVQVEYVVTGTEATTTSTSSSTTSTSSSTTSTSSSTTSTSSSTTSTSSSTTTSA